MYLQIRYDFDKYQWADINWIIDAENWSLLCKINEDGLWRVAYPEEPGISPEEIENRRAKKLKTIMPGNPDPKDYEIELSMPYKIHQRLAEHMRVGRFLLAGDAAHLNNPM